MDSQKGGCNAPSAAGAATDLRSPNACALHAPTRRGSDADPRIAPPDGGLLIAYGHLVGAIWVWARLRRAVPIPVVNACEFQRRAVSGS